MKKKQIISLGGELASGKGTVSKILKETLKYELYKNGDYFRKLAKEMNMDITTFNKYVKNHPEIDKQIEKSAEKYAKEHDNIIIDARLGWYAVPESFKVYMKVNIDVAAKRAFQDELRKNTESFNTVEEQKKDMKERYKLENERYLEVYNVRKEDESNYDYIIDTTNLTPEEVATNIEIEYKKWLEE